MVARARHQSSLRGGEGTGEEHAGPDPSVCAHVVKSSVQCHLGQWGPQILFPVIIKAKIVRVYFPDNGGGILTVFWSQIYLPFKKVKNNKQVDHFLFSEVCAVCYWGCIRI